MSQRFSAQHRYQEILSIFQRWPGLGSIAAKRLFQAGTSQKQFAAQLKRLSHLFEQLAPCATCLIPQVVGQECANCAKEPEFSKILVLGIPSDAFVLQSMSFLKNYYVIAMPSYLSTQSCLQSAERQLSYIAKLLMLRPIEHCLILFNQSLEARSTLWMLKQRCTADINWKDASFLCMDKDNLGHFSDAELKIYEQQLQQYLLNS